MNRPAIKIKSDGGHWYFYWPDNGAWLSCSLYNHIPFNTLFNIGALKGGYL